MGVYEDGRVELLYGAQVFALDIENKVVKSVLLQQNKEEKKAVGEMIALGANPIFNSNILLNSKDAHPLTEKV
jgi:hypothetical protein